MLKSIFDLPKSKDQLEPASTFANYKWLQKAPLRNIKDTDDTQNFSRGQMTFRWDLGSSTFFMPSKVFARIRMKLTKGDNQTPLTTADGIGPSMGIMGQLINECNFTVNNQQVSVADRHIGEISSMYHRINKSGQWLRDVGNSVNFWEADREKRIQHVSGDGQEGDIAGAGNCAEIKDRTALGIAATVTIVVTAATHILAFAGAGSAGTAPKFKSGDIIVLDVAVDAGFKRAFYVVSVLTDLTLQLATLGTTLGADVAVAITPLQRFRYSKANVIDYVIIDPATTQVASTAANLLTANAGTFQGLHPGDVAALALNGGTVHNGQVITENLTATTARGSSFNPSIVVAAGGANPYPIIRYENIEITNTADLGYVQNSQLNGHAIDVAVNAGGNALLTITRLGTSSEIPRVRDHWKVGDIIIVSYNDGAVTTGQLMVIEVDPSNNGRSLSVIGSQVLAAATGLNTDGRNYITRRIRYNGAGESRIANDARQVSEFEISWAPRCLSVFRLPHALPGGAKFELNLTMKNLYREAAIESIANKAVRSGGNANDYNFQIISMFLYVPTFEGKPYIDKTQFYLDLNEIRCQKVDITSQETSYTLDVRPSTNALAVATQSSSVDNTTNWSSAKYVSENDYHLKMSAFHVRYAASQKPIPSFDMSLDERSGAPNQVARIREHWNEIYMRNLLATNAYFDSSSESIQEYFKRGPYIFQNWARSADDRETRVYVTASYSEEPGGVNNNPKLLLFNFYKKYAICKLNNGRWEEILVQEA